jgi:hypothetical protein
MRGGCACERLGASVYARVKVAVGMAGARVTKGVVVARKGVAREGVSREGVAVAVAREGMAGKHQSTTRKYHSGG